MKIKLVLLIFLQVFLVGSSLAIIEQPNEQPLSPEEVEKSKKEYHEREIQSKISKSDNIFIGKIKSAKQFEYSSGDGFLGKIEIEIEPIKNIKGVFNTNQLLYIYGNCNKNVFYQLDDKGVTCEGVVKDGENIFLVASRLEKYWTPFINKNTIEMMYIVSPKEIKNTNDTKDVFNIFSHQNGNSDGITLKNFDVFKINYALYVIIFLGMFGVFVYCKKNK